MPRCRSSSIDRERAGGGWRRHCARPGGKRRSTWPGCSLGLRAALVLLLSLVPVACLLSTRDDEGGETGPSLKWLDPVHLGNALGNMRRSLEGKDLTNYGKSFSSEHFELVLDEADVSELGQNEFEEWSATQEEQRMSGILGSSEATLTVYWSARDSVDETATVRYYRDLTYRLEFHEATRSATYSGKADLWFEDNGAGLWFITKWVDKRDGSPYHTWGWLRARNQVEF